MDERRKRHAALYVLIKLVDNNNGEVIIDNDKVHRVFNDENEYVHIEYKDGTIGLLADADFKTMDDAIRHWQKVNKMSVV